MSPTPQGSFRLFRLLGIDVYVHWSWFVVALYSISNRVQNYHAPFWGALEYLALFLVVLMHEFGHSLACRQVGGNSDQIVLWPLGGVAYVNPPQRPGATLWSIAAGPLVNLLLLPILYAAFYFAGGAPESDQRVFMRYLLFMDFGLLAFNLLPAYPLDGGQILRSLLWFPLGKARSLKVSTVVGFMGGLGLVALALWWRSIWIGIMAFYLLNICWKSFQHAQVLRKIERLPRRADFACPSCHVAPPLGDYWLCPQCRQPFDPFATSSTCPHCQAVLALVSCPDCGTARTQRAWDTTIRDA